MHIGYETVPEGSQVWVYASRDEATAAVEQRVEFAEHHDPRWPPPAFVLTDYGPAIVVSPMTCH